MDHEGEVLEAFVSKTRDKKAALKFLRKLMKRHGRAEELVTDGLKSYGAALKGCCQTNANSSRFRQVHGISAGAELPPLGESGGAVQLVDASAGQAPI